MDGGCSRGVGEKFLESGHTGGANLFPTDDDDAKSIRSVQCEKNKGI